MSNKKHRNKREKNLTKNRVSLQRSLFIVLHSVYIFDDLIYSWIYYICITVAVQPLPEKFCAKLEFDKPYANPQRLPIESKM